MINKSISTDLWVKIMRFHSVHKSIFLRNLELFLMSESNIRMMIIILIRNVKILSTIILPGSKRLRSSKAAGAINSTLTAKKNPLNLSLLFQIDFSKKFFESPIKLIRLSIWKNLSSEIYKLLTRTHCLKNILNKLKIKRIINERILI